MSEANSQTGGGTSAHEAALTPVPPAVDARTAFALSGIYGITGAIAAVLLVPMIAQHTEVNLPLPLPVFALLLAVQITVIYGLLAWAGLRMARRRGLHPAPMFTLLWLGHGVRFAWRGRGRGLILAAVAGMLSGAALLVVVTIISRVFPGTLPSTLHPPDAMTALASSTAAAFGEEILCRLFLLSLILRLLPARMSPMMRTEIPSEARNGAPGGPGIANALSAVLFGVLHLPALVALSGGFGGVPALAWAWIILFNALVGLVFGALYLRAGIGAAITGHWFCDLIWHVGVAVI